MTDHATFVRIRDRTRFEFLHRSESGLDPRLHFREEIVTEVDAADVDREIELVDVQIVLFEAFPGHDIKN